jgi:hypothetical protein
MGVDVKMIRIIVFVIILFATPALAYEGQISPGHVWGNPGATQANGRDSSPSGILGRKGIFFADDYATTHDKIVDDVTAIQNAVNAASAAGGGTVWIGPYSYLIDGADLSVPQGVTLACSMWAGARPPSGNDFTAKKCALYLNPSHTIRLSGGLRNLYVLNKDLPALTDVRGALTAVNAFSGTAITISQRDSHTENVVVGGFATCWSSSGYPRPVVNNLFGDCTNGMVADNVHDVGKVTNLEFWPFITTNASWSVTSYAVSGAADNGAGIYRLTVPANVVINGDTVWVKGVGGSLGANGKFTASVFDSTHIDLVGSSTAPTTTGNTTSGLTYVPVASVDNLVIGQTVSGTNIPSGATIAAVWHYGSAISLDSAHAATGTATGTTLTFGNGAYTSGGAAVLSTTYRAGTGILVSNTEDMDFVNTFAWEYNIGYDFGPASQGTQMLNSLFDCNTSTGCYGMIGIRFTGANTWGNMWRGTNGGAYETGIVADTSGINRQENLVGDLSIADVATTMAEVYGGSVALANLKGHIATRILHSNLAYLTITGLAGPFVDYYTNVATNTSVHVDGATWLHGTNTIGASQFYSVLANSHIMYSSFAATDLKTWEFFTGSQGDLILRAQNDAMNSNNTAMRFYRGTTTTVDHISMFTGASLLAFNCDNTQHCQTANARIPTIASGACGALTNGTIAAGSNDQGMIVEIGAAATTSCAISFGATWATRPRSCVFSPHNAAAAAAPASLIWNTTTITLAGAALANTEYTIACQ